jgi:hypothetical protein
MTQNTDSRLAKAPDDDIVGQRDRVTTRRDDRRTEDRGVTESRELSEDDRLEMFRNQLFNDALPDLPATPGWHMCWLTTTNPRDPIHRRMQLGYEALRPDEVPGMEYASLKTGEYVGMVGINEMLAFKLPMSLYLRYMQEAHHDAPAREEDKLADTADLIREQAERSGSSIQEDEGIQDLRSQSPRRGIFA